MEMYISRRGSKYVKVAAVYDLYRIIVNISVCVGL